MLRNVEGMQMMARAEAVACMGGEDPIANPFPLLDWIQGMPTFPNPEQPQKAEW